MKYYKKFASSSFAAAIIALSAAPLAMAQSPLNDRQTANEINAANTLLRDGKVDEALDAYRKVLPDQQQRDALNYNMAVAEYRKGNIAAAEELFTEVVGTDSPTIAADSRYNLGNCQYAGALKVAEHDKPAAIEFLRRAIANYRGALRGKPNNPDARANIELAGELIRRLEQEQQKEEQQKEQQKKEDDQQQQDEDKQQDQQNKDQQKQDEQKQDNSQDSESQKDQPQKDQPQKDQSQKEGDQQEKADSQHPKSDQEKSDEQKKHDEQTDADQQQNDKQKNDEQKENKAADKEQENDQQEPSDKQKSSEQQSPSKSSDSKQKPQQKSGDQDKTNDEGAPEEQNEKHESVPTGDLKAASEQEQNTKPENAVGTADQNGKDGLMTREEALKMLQSVRDRDMLRRMQQQRQERSRRVRVDKDW